MKFLKIFTLPLLILSLIAEPILLNASVIDKQAIALRNKNEKVEIIDWTSEISPTKPFEYYRWWGNPSQIHDPNFDNGGYAGSGVSFNKDLEEQEWLSVMDLYFPKELTKEEGYKYLRFGFFKKEFIEDDPIKGDRRFNSSWSHEYNIEEAGFEEITIEEAEELYYDGYPSNSPWEIEEKSPYSHWNPDDLWIGLVPDERVEDNPLVGFLMLCGEGGYEPIITKSLDLKNSGFSQSEFYWILYDGFQSITGDDDFYGKDVQEDYMFLTQSILHRFGEYYTILEVRAGIDHNMGFVTPDHLFSFVEVVISDIPGYEGDDVVTEYHIPEQGFKVQIRPRILTNDYNPPPNDEIIGMLFTNWDSSDGWLFEGTYRNPEFDFGGADNSGIDSSFGKDVIEVVIVEEENWFTLDKIIIIAMIIFLTTILIGLVCVLIKFNHID